VIDEAAEKMKNRYKDDGSHQADRKMTRNSTRNLSISSWRPSASSPARPHARVDREMIGSIDNGRMVEKSTTWIGLLHPTTSTVLAEKKPGPAE